MPAGYSGTPLIKKLGIKPGMRVRIIEAPPHYENLIGPLPPDVQVMQSTRNTLDFIHCFVRTRAALGRALPKLAGRLELAGMLWMSWPKKSSPLVGEISEADVRRAGLDAGLVDVKICAVDDDWSGLKFVIPKADRPAAKRP